ncbi:transforming growth factor beta receptor type 3-like, partial [Limulus polyphemus]|uniref:Transforming growth factor beta receptor type 3-like n=1 Tax=Limulus polyphemus TaxID=6850 RepID=A0ABM1SXA5_LIMPO
GRSPESCEVTNEVKVDNVEASFIQPQPASGCTALQNIASSSRDVHIVKLRSAGESDEVVIHLQPQGAPETNAPSKPIIIKDLVLILKSDSAVRWRIDSWGLQGIVQVVAEHQVTPGSVPDFQFIQVRVQSLSNDTEELVSEVINAFGNVSTIMETNTANRINIMVVGETVGTDHYNVQSDDGSPQGGFSVSRGQSRFLRPQQSDFSATVSSQISPLPWDKLRRGMSELPLNLKGFSKTSMSTKSRETWNSKDKTTVTNTFLQKWQGNADANLTLELESLMTLECQKNMIKITFPKSSTEDIAMRINGANIHWLEVTLQDQECKATSNSTHFILNTSLQNCGFNVVSDGGKYIYRNQVLFWTPVGPDTHKIESIDYDDSFADDEDAISPEEGSGMEHYLRQALAAHRGVTHSRLLSGQSFQCAYNFTGDGSRPKVGNHDHVYHMELFKDSTLHKMLQKKNGLAEVLARDKVYVRTSIDAGPNLYIVTDECWLSLTDNSLLDVDNREVLIQHSCPKHLSVGLLNMGPSGGQETSREPTHQQGFFFQLTEKWISKKVYLHCRLAACSEKINIPISGVKQCINPNDYCVGNSIKQYLVSRAGKHFSIEVAGPLLVLPPRRSHSFKGGDSKIVPSLPDDSAQVEVDADLCVKQKLIGLSTGAVVGIAFASFIIGAGLMAILWFIHLCTDPSRRTRAQQQGGVHHHHRHHHSGYDLSGHSGSSTPSSQAPMTVQVCS